MQMREFEEAVEEAGEEIDGEEDDYDYDDDEAEGIGAAECEYYIQAIDDPDPLGLCDDDSLEVHPYEQFERTDYEALAARKRKSISNCRSDGLAKKRKKDDVYGDCFDQIMEHVGHRWRRRRKSDEPKKRGRRKGSKNKLSPEITKKLGDANLYYATGNYVDAINILKEVVRVAPTLGDPYHMLGLIYNAIGDKSRALNFYILAACLTPKDPYLWKLLVARSLFVPAAT